VGACDGRPLMHPALTSFLSDPELRDFDPAAGLTEAFVLLDREAVHSPDARAVLRAFTWIVAQLRPLKQKLEALDKLTAHSMRCRGSHVLLPSLRRFLDWPAA
jgi:hypothetical protein